MDSKEDQNPVEALHKLATGRFPGALPPKQWTHLSSPNGSLDFRPAIEGLGPDCQEAECEHCHLDEVEESRFQDETRFRVPSPETRKLVITASRDMGRTASTWVFNAVRLLFRQAGESCDPYWIRQLTKEKLFERLAHR